MLGLIGFQQHSPLHIRVILHPVEAASSRIPIINGSVNKLHLMMMLPFSPKSICALMLFTIMEAASCWVKNMVLDGTLIDFNDVISCIMLDLIGLTTSGSDVIMQ